MDRSTPCILVHGITDTAADMSAIAAFLEEHGYVTHSITIKPNDGSIPILEAARQLDEFVNSVAGTQEINLIAFSMGGLISAAWLLKSRGKERTQSFVSISAPLHGTPMAYCLNFPGIRDMQPFSPLVKEIVARDSELTDIQVTTISTHFDTVVFPSHTSELWVAGERNFKLYVPTHRRMLFSPKVHQLILQGLAGS